MATELAKAYVQIVPSANGISGSISKVLNSESTSAGKTAGTNIASSIASTLTTALAAAGISKIISNVITSGSEYETAIAKLGTIADTSAVSIDSMKTTISGMSDELGVAQSDLAEAAYSTISATGDTAGALDIVAQSAKLATAGFTDTDSAISVLTTAMNAYGLEAEDVEHISDSLVTTQNLGVTTVAELSSNMGRAIASASAYNVSLENLEAAYISTTKSGISTAESTTYISSMLSELGDAGSDVGAILQEQTGQSFGELMESGASLGDVLGILSDSVDGNSEAFMNLWSSQEAGKAANSIVNQGLETFNENLETLEEQTGTTETAYSQMTDTFAWKSEDLQTKVQNLGIQLFEDLYPVLDDLIAMAMDFVDNMDMDSISETITSLVEAVTPMLSTIGDVLGFVAEHLDVILTFVSALVAIGIIAKIISLVSTITSLTNPIGIVITLIATVITVLVSLYQNNEEFREIVDTVWNAVQTVISTVIEVVTGIISTFKEVIQGLQDKFGELKENVSEKFNAIKDTMTDTMESAKDGISDTLDNMQSAFEEHGGGITGIAAAAMEGVKGYFQTGYNVVNTLTGGRLGEVVSKFTSKMSDVKTKVSSGLETVKTYFSTKLTSAKSTVSTKMGDIVSKFGEKMESAKKKVSEGIEKIKGFFNFTWSLPSLKLPHISISGKFSLNPVSVPKFGISWYDEGGIFTSPSIIGVGEKRPEFVGALDDLRGIVRDESSTGSEDMIQYMARMLEFMEQYFPEFANAEMVTDTGAVVGWLTKPMDKALGQLSTAKERGR